jgi:hypothetical protein
LKDRLREVEFVLEPSYGEQIKALGEEILAEEMLNTK